MLKSSRLDREVSRKNIVKILRTEITNRREIKNLREINKLEITLKEC